MRRATTWVLAAGLLLAITAVDAEAQTQGPAAKAAAPTAPVAQGGAIEKLSGVWVEGPGFDITYGKDYEACAARCLGHARCVMIEYYRPEKKCNLYDSERPRLKGGSSFVGIRKAVQR